MDFEHSILAAFAAVGNQLVETKAREEIARKEKIDLMRNVCGLECVRDELKDKIAAANHLLDASAGAGVDSWAAAVREALK